MVAIVLFKMNKSAPSSAVDTSSFYQFITMANNIKSTAYTMTMFVPLMYGLLPQLTKSEIVRDVSTRLEFMTFLVFVFQQEIDQKTIML